MYRPALQKKQPFGVSRQTIIPAPIRGLRSDEGLAKEQPGAAILMTNWVAETDAIRLRKGFATHLTGMSDPAETLMVYTSGTTSKMFVAAGTSIYDATTAGAVGAAVVSSTTNARWSHTNFTTSGGHYLVLTNGAAGVRNYDGSSWTSPSITGATSADLTYVWPFKTRLWFIEKDSMKAWYLAVDSISGAATAFPLGNLFKRGGKLIAGGTLSYDSGDGIDDLNVFVTSEGEVAIYEMTDPGTTSTLALKGLYYIGKPIGDRCLYNVGGDLLILTYSGLIPLSKAISLDKAVIDAGALTAPIRREFSDVAVAYGTNDGWQVITFPVSNLIIVNVPEIENSTSRQYVANLLSTAWSKWTGITALCWAVFNDDLYFGGTDGVYQAETGSGDNGSPIEAEVIPSFSQLGYPVAQKHVQIWRPIVRTNIDGIGGVQTVVDYNDPTSVPNQEQAVDISAFTWDVSDWDEATWAGLSTVRQIRSGTNIGTAVAPHYAITIDSTDEADELEFRLIGFECIYKVGNVL